VRGQPLESLGIAVKDSDSRSRKYLERYGANALCWEADVLPAQVIEDALDYDIRSWLDQALWDQRAREIETARSLL
jgi:hypothetical protein